jgi:hypothetical protein
MATKHTILKKTRDKIIAALPQEGLIDFACMPASLMASYTGSPRTIREALDWYCAEHDDLICIDNGPVPKYTWIKDDVHSCEETGKY